MLRGRRVVLAVTGGVAAYKSAYLARRLVEVEAEVEVALTESALEFVGAQTFAAITGHQPHTGFFGKEIVSPHTDLAQWADLVVVAPATAATIARVANGLSDDLVSAILLAYTGPVLIAPAMHTEMWEHPATERNIETLRGDGYHIVGPESGPLAGGDVGTGRVAEPDDILEAIVSLLAPAADARRYLVTAGGTREPVDPVRFLGNRSSGKMGHAIANEAARRGMDVTLVTTSDLPVVSAVKVVSVETAQEMLEAVSGIETDVAVMAAAVADFRPANPSQGKLSRSEGLDSIDLEPNPDILASVAARESRPYIVGFAAETGDLGRAIEKAKTKNVDLLVYNDVSEPGSGFGTDTNRVVVIDGAGNTDAWPVMPKGEVAARLIDRIMDEAEAKG
ncbi:MAG TPA: bifunctional phosphopantothenoylcysteine decarboxylase/phosphopantothenate--cysteine ligase CoaBC [Acidimicrobiia bacterium]|nr:bifunctional phosphopantothenoylcysteine decarboxylase/phosphopantothenate--cysteine ligase CoaBC [Acidimicrobiia bacterium]